MKEKRIISLILGYGSKVSLLTVLWKQKMRFVCYFFFMSDSRISRVHVGEGMTPHFLPATELWQFTLFTLFVKLCVLGSALGYFSSGHCNLASSPAVVEVSANLTRAHQISSLGKVVEVILKLGEQDWKITQLGTNTSHIKYSQME